MNKNKQMFIKNINRTCGVVGGVVFIGELLLVVLKCINIISLITLTVSIISLALLWWLVFCIKIFAERKIINEMKAWAQNVVDTNYYNGQKITVEWRNGVWFSGPDDRWFVKKFKEHSREVFKNTGMKIYYNYWGIIM